VTKHLSDLALLVQSLLGNCISLLCTIAYAYCAWLQQMQSVTDSISN